MFSRLTAWFLNNKEKYLPPDTIRRRFARGTFWLITGTVLGQGLTFITSIFAARLLGKESYGELGMIQSTLSTFGIFSGLGLGVTATKYLAELREKDPARGGRIVGLMVAAGSLSGLILSAVIFFTAPWIAAKILNAPALADELRLGSIYIFLNAVNSVRMGALSGLEAFRTVMAVSLLQGIMNLPLTVVLVRWFGLKGAVLAFLLTAAATWVYSTRSLRGACRSFNIPVIYSGLLSEIPLLLRFSLPVFLSSVIYSLILWLTNAVIVHLPNGYSEIGLVTVAMQWRLVIVTLPMLFCNAALPILSAEANAAAHANYVKVADLTQLLSLLIVIPLSTFLIFFSDVILALYGSEFAGGSGTLIGVVLGTAVSGIGSVFAPAIVARGLVWFGALQNTVWGAILVLCVYFGGPLIGAKAYALGFSAAYFTVTFWSALYLRNYLSKGMIRRTFFAALYTGILALLGMMMTPPQRMIAAIPAVIISIAVTLFGFIGAANVRKYATLGAEDPAEKNAAENR